MQEYVDSSADDRSRYATAALDHVEDAILVLSAERIEQYANPRAMELFGAEGGAELPLPDHAWSRLEEGQPWSGEIGLRRAEGERRLRVDARVIEGAAMLLVVKDVTEMERLRSIAGAVNLSDNLGHFLSGIRHELGNPVNSIKTALTVVHSNLESFSREKVSHYLDRVLGEVGRIEYLLRSLRSFSQHESVTLGRVDVGDFVEKVVALAGPSISKSKVRLVSDSVPASPTFIVADVRALYQILLNLISNAIEAEPGPVDPTIRIELSVGRDYVDIAVVDNGKGMSSDDVALAMRPFFTTKRHGTGLGLVIAQGLASSQGGQLRLHSELGQGTRAVISLARATEEERQT